MNDVCWAISLGIFPIKVTKECATQSAAIRSGSDSGLGYRYEWAKHPPGEAHVSHSITQVSLPGRIIPEKALNGFHETPVGSTLTSLESEDDVEAHRTA